jgi:hypothetical protein
MDGMFFKQLDSLYFLRKIKYMSIQDRLTNRSDAAFDRKEQRTELTPVDGRGREKEREREREREIEKKVDI